MSQKGRKKSRLLSDSYRDNARKLEASKKNDIGAETLAEFRKLFRENLRKEHSSN